MAEKDTSEESESSAEAKPKVPLSGKKKLMVLAAIGLLVVGASVGGTLYLLGVFDSSEEAVAEEMSAEAAADEPAIEKPSPAMYFPIKPAFVVNFPDRGKQRYLQVDITVMTRNPDIFTALQTHLPLIKNRLVMLMSSEVYDELQTDEGKELLRQRSLEALKEIMKQEAGTDDIEQVLFTNFVMQ